MGAGADARCACAALVQIVISLSNSFFSIVAGVAVFSVLGFMANEQHMCITEVAEGGPGLAFVVFPTALCLMPGARVFTALFFAMLLALGVDSAFSMVESFNTALLDAIPPGREDLRRAVTPALCIIGWLAGALFCTEAGYFWLDVFNKCARAQTQTREHVSARARVRMQAHAHA